MVVVSYERGRVIENHSSTPVKSLVVGCVKYCIFSFKLRCSFIWSRFVRLQYQCRPIKSTLEQPFGAWQKACQTSCGNRVYVGLSRRKWRGLTPHSRLTGGAKPKMNLPAIGLQYCPRQLQAHAACHYQLELVSQLAEAAMKSRGGREAHP
jgi:hypothetical protein